REENFLTADRLRCPRGAKAGLLRPHNHHRFLSPHLHAAARRRPTVPTHGLDRGFRPARRASVRAADCARALPPRLPRWKNQGVAKPDDAPPAELLPPPA